MIGVLHHLTNIKKKLDKLIESAVPSTIFVAIEPNKANFFIQLLRRVRKKVDVSYSKEQTYFSKSELFNIFERLDKEELKSILADHIDLLPEKEKKVISLYYFKEYTMKRIGEVLNLTESRVSQIHTKAVLRLRGKLKKSYY